MTNITLISNYLCCVDPNLEFCCFSSNLSAISVLNISQMEPFPSRLAFLPKTILADLSACLLGWTQWRALSVHHFITRLLFWKKQSLGFRLVFVQVDDAVCYFQSRMIDQQKEVQARTSWNCFNVLMMWCVNTTSLLSLEPRST